VVAKPEEMRLSTLEKYFFNPDGRGQKLMTLSYCDISATIPPSGKPDYLLLKKFLKKINQVKEKVKAKQKEDRLPPPLLDGREIMELLGLESGPKIGEIKDQLRDKELAGELKDKREAQDWLRKKGESKD
jgi:tRNA nucleotidyltransferase/poly(A) polymerase